MAPSMRGDVNETVARLNKILDFGDFFTEALKENPRVDANDSQGQLLLFFYIDAMSRRAKHAAIK